MSRTHPHWNHWYNKERWRRIAKQQLMAEPLCRLCAGRGLVTPATIADHIVPHAGDVEAFWGGELQSLCVPCHQSPKRMLEGRGYLPDIGLDGLPIDRRHPCYGRS
jgi:5-methylcytosine-specific restriction endonuclease McrA